MLNKKVLYRDIYPDYLVEYFGEHKHIFDDLYLKAYSCCIDLDEIAMRLGLKVNLNGYTFSFDDETKTIEIPNRYSNRTKRALIAHMIGHYLSNTTDEHKKAPKDNTERAADQFAKELLIPKEVISRTIQDYMFEHKVAEDEIENEMNDDIISHIAKKIKLNKEYVEYRMFALLFEAKN